MISRHKLIAFGMFAVLMTASLVSAISPQTVVAVSASDWKAGQIMDDALFYNNTDMSVGDIQSYLNTKVPTCDTWGTQTSEYGGGTRAQYGTSRGYAPPYICLKDYYENPSTHANNLGSGNIPSGSLSSAQIIKNAADTYGISVRVLLTTLQKESSGPLITDSWPFPVQYVNPMGYGCPDTAACDPAYAGFYNQVTNAARQFSLYRSQASDYRYKAFQNNSILYSPNSACGSSTVFLQNYATAGLYDYTPYQPDAAALANLYGTGDGCSAYGNRNFWRIFNDWFGPSIIDVYPWAIKEATGGDGRYWLVIGNTKRWIPNGTILNDWNLGSYPHQFVSQSDLDAIPTLPNLSNLGVTNTGDYVFVDNGQKYYLGNNASIANWGYGNSLQVAVPLYSILAGMPNQGTGTVNQYVKNTSGQNYLMSGGVLYPINSGSVGRWAIPNSTMLTTDDIALLPQGSAINYQVSFGGKNYIADMGNLLSIDANAAAAYGSQIATGFVAINGATGNVFPTYAANQFVQQSGSSTCYYIVDGKRRYVLNGQVVSAWGNNSQAQVISSTLLNSLTDGGLLGTVAETTPDNSYYLLDGSAHKISSDLVNAYTTGITPIQVAASNFTVAQGSQITSPIFQLNGTPDIYTAIAGKYYHINNGNELNAFGYASKYQLQTMNQASLFSLSYGGGVGKIMSYGGTTYYLQDAKAYPIDAAYLPNWLGSTTAPAYPGTDFTTRFAVQSTILQDLVKDSTSKTWLVDGGRLLNITSFADAYTFRTPASLDASNMPKVDGGTYLVRSSNTSDSRIWLINQGVKQWIVTAAEYYGFGGNSTPTTTLSDTELAKIPTASQLADPSIMVYSGTNGLKFLNGTGFYEFPVSGTTTSNVLSGNPILALSPSVYAVFQHSSGAISQLIKDVDTQQIYYIQNGQKHWITNGTAFRAYSSLPLVTVPGYFAQWLPTGSPIN